jgi:hypothetical protein
MNPVFCSGSKEKRDRAGPCFPAYPEYAKRQPRQLPLGHQAAMYQKAALAVGTL